MKRLICLTICCVLIILSLTGCRAETGTKGKLIRCDIPGAVTNLDPQFATDTYARMIIANINEGLLSRDGEGKLVPGAAESFDISSDGTVLTFKLRENLIWHNNDNPVTADDFVFAFHRMFAPDSPSPFANDYIAIENAAEILAKTESIQNLGVMADGKYTLTIRLAHPSPFFPANLAETPAMPCSKEFFEESRGRYGLDRSFVTANGPFYLSRWDNEASINLRPNSKYKSGAAPLVTGVNLYINNEDALTRMQDGLADYAYVSFEGAEKLKTQGCEITGLDNTVWCIVFNQGSGTWGNPLLRQGLSQTIDPRLLTESLPEKLKLTNLLVPPSCALADKPYREAVKASAVEFDPEQGRRLFEMGLSALDIDSVTDSTLYVPDSPGHMIALGMLQQSWQKHLSAYINVETVGEEEMEERFLSGDYGMMLMPLRPESQQAESLLSIFSSGSRLNRFGYRNEIYDNQLKLIAGANDIGEAAEICARAESLLLQDAVVIPVYIETTALAVSFGLSGINPTAFPNELSFKFAEK